MYNFVLFGEISSVFNKCSCAGSAMSGYQYLYLCPLYRSNLFLQFASLQADSLQNMEAGCVPPLSSVFI